MRRAAWIWALAVVVLALGCNRPMSMEEMEAKLTAGGLEVAEPDYGPIGGIIRDAEDSLNAAQELGPNRPTIKTVELDGVMTNLYRFNSAKEAKVFYELASKAPQGNDSLPARMKKALGKPHLILHKNFVLRMNVGLLGRDDSATISKVERALGGE